MESRAAEPIAESPTWDDTKQALTALTDAGAAQDPPWASLERLIVGMIANLLELSPDQIDPGARLGDYGLGSVHALRLATALSEHLEQDVPATLPWQCPTIRRMAQHLAGVEQDQGPATGRRQVLEPIALIGMACRFPGGADTLEGYFQVLAHGVDTTREVPGERWVSDQWYAEDPTEPGKIVSRRGAFLDQVDLFDPAFFGISPREAHEMDPQQRLFLEMAWEALEDAGIQPSALRDSQTAVFVGAMWQDYGLLSSADPLAIAQHTLAGQDTSIIPARVSYALGLRGPCLTVNTACSSALVAVHLAMASLHQGEAELALVGGINLMLAPHTAVALTKFGGLAPDGRCKTFSAAADGYGRGEGGGVVVLKLLSKALLEADHIYCVIRGSATNNDGASNGMTAPSLEAQREVLASAWARAGASPADAAYIEAHGTGTKLGDPIEAEALGSIFGRDRATTRPLRIGSVKTNIGHLEAAAGIAGLIKLALALSRNALFPSLHFHQPNPHIDFQRLKLTVQTHFEPWPETSRLVGISGFGFGGTNCHLVLDGAPGADLRPGLREPVLQSRGGRRPLVFVYAGYGNHWAGMGQQLFYQEPVFREAIRACDEAIRPIVDFSLLEAFCAPPQHPLPERIEIGESLMFAFQYGLTRLLASWNLEPDMVLGQSLGEMMAALSAGVLDLADAARVVVGFGRAGDQVRDRGGMAVLVLPRAEVELLIANMPIEVAGVLAPRNTVVSGDIHALEDLLRDLRGQGVDVFRIHTRYACHCFHMRSQLGMIERLLAPIKPKPARIPFYATTFGRRMEGPECDAAYWADNNQRTVQTVQAVEAILEQGDAVFLEIGPHPVLRQPFGQIFAAARGGQGSDSVVIGTVRRAGNERENLMDALDQLRAQQVEIGDVAQSRLWPPAGSRYRQRRLHVFPLSAKHPDALGAMRQRLALHLENRPELALPDLAYSLATSRSQFGCRAAFVAADRKSLIAELLDPNAGFQSQQPPESAGKIAFLFTGQGSQYVGMGRDLYDTHATFREALDACAQHLADHLELPLLEVMFGERADAATLLDRTLYTQPALFALNYATCVLWRSWGVQPGAVMGHSVGEFAAACAAGLFSLADGCRFVAERAKLMNELPEGGGMLAVRATVERVLPFLAGFPLWLAADNGRNATVVSGATGDLDDLEQRLASAGIGASPLRVSHAFHSGLMDPILARFKALAETINFRPLSLRLVCNLSGDWADQRLATPAYWVDQLRQPVLFQRGIHTLYEAGFTSFVEVGPRPFLLGMASHCLSEQAAVMALPSMSKSRGADLIRESLAKLYATDLRIDWRSYFAHMPVTRVPLPSYPFLRSRYWSAAKRLGSAQARMTPVNRLHPLLDGRLVLAHRPQDILFQARLKRELLGFLQGHQPQGHMRLPTSAWLEMMVVAARQAGLALPLHLEDLNFGREPVLDERELQVQLLLEQGPSGATKLALHTLTEGTDVCEVRAEGTLLRHPVPLLEPTDLGQLVSTFPSEAAKSRLAELVNEDALIDESDTLLLHRLWQDGGRALGLVELDGGAVAPFTLHPRLFKTCLQIASACLPRRDARGYFAVATMRRLTQFRELTRRIWCLAVSPRDGAAEVDLTLFDEQGQLLVRVEGIGFAWHEHEETAQSELLFVPQWERMPHFKPHPAALNGSWLILDGTQGVGAALALAMRALGERCQLARPGSAFEQLGPDLFGYDPGVAEHYAALLQASLREGVAPRAIVYLAGLDASLEASDAPFQQHYRLSCGGLLALLQAVLAHCAVPPSLFVVTRGSQALPDSPCTGFAQAPLWNLGRVMAAEHPELHVRCLDLDPLAPANETQVLAEKMRNLMGGVSPENLIALRGNLAYVVRLVRYQPPPEGGLVLRPEGTYLITGGLGGLGLSLASFLVDRGARHLVLTSRRGASSNGQSEAVASMTARGATVHVVAADIASATDVDQLLRSLSGPPLRGIVHAAGVLEDGVLAHMDDERFQRVLAPKLAGAWNLHRASLDQPLDFFILFSSVAALFSPSGQGNYSAANGFLASLAQWRSGHGLPALCIDWGAFENLGMTGEGLNRIWAERGLRPFQPHQGWLALAALPQTSGLEVGVAAMGQSAFGKDWADSPLFAALRPRREVVAPKLADTLRELAPHERGHQLAHYLRGVVGDLLGYAPSDPLPRKENFSDLGLDSLQAVELRNRLQSALQCKLPAALIFECPNLERLEAYVGEQVFGPASPTPPPTPSAAAPQDEELAALMQACGDLDGEVERMIDAELDELIKLGIEL